MIKGTSISSGAAELKTLFEAIAARDLDLVSRLLAQSPMLARQANSAGATRQNPREYFFESIGHYAYGGDTPLHIAAAAHAPDIVDALLAHGADVHARNRRGAEPLHYAADGNPDAPHWNPDAQAAVIQRLIRAGANPNALDKDGVAPLHRAVRTRCAAAVHALLVGGAEPRLQNKSGPTTIFLARCALTLARWSSVTVPARPRRCLWRCLWRCRTPVSPPLTIGNFTALYSPWHLSP